MTKLSEKEAEWKVFHRVEFIGDIIVMKRGNMLAPAVRLREPIPGLLTDIENVYFRITASGDPVDFFRLQDDEIYPFACVKKPDSVGDADLTEYQRLMYPSVVAVLAAARKTDLDKRCALRDALDLAESLYDIAVGDPDTN